MYAQILANVAAGAHDSARLIRPALLSLEEMKAVDLSRVRLADAERAEKRHYECDLLGFRVNHSALFGTSYMAFVVMKADHENGFPQGATVQTSPVVGIDFEARAFETLNGKYSF